MYFTAILRLAALALVVWVFSTTVYFLQHTSISPFLHIQSTSSSLFTSKQRRHSYKNLFSQFSPEFREGLHYVMRRKIQL